MFGSRKSPASLLSDPIASLEKMFSMYSYRACPTNGSDCGSLRSHNLTLFVMSASAVQMFIGLSVVTLGIIAVIGTEPLVLSLVALLAIEFGNLFGGKGFNDRVLGVFR
jgi:hypothetical protein